MQNPPASIAQETNLSRSNVLIVGGGPAGLATALMLAKRGWTDITVLEKRVAADYYEPDKSFNYQIDGRGQKFTDLMGITDQLPTIGVPNTEFYLTRIQPNGKRKTLKVPMADPTRKTAYWITRRAFVQLLYQEVKQNWKDQITVLFNSQCIQINKPTIHDGEGEKLEVIVQGENDHVDRFEPCFLIGCDGIQSIVRNTLKEWDSDRTDRFEMQLFPSPSSGLRYKVLSLPPKFPLDPQGQEHSVSTMSYSIRGALRDRRQFFSLGLLPIKDPEAPRTANIVTYPNHQIWELKTGEAMLNFFEQSFPQFPIRQIVSSEEIDRFARSEGGSFPIPQYCSGLHVLLKQTSPNKESTDQRVDQSTGVLLLGDAIHCFPPDIGQGVNAALEDVYVLSQALSQTQDDLSRALPLYESLRSPDVSAVVRLAQIGAPWQYNQDRLRTRLWMVKFLLRLALSRLFPFMISPPAFFMIQNHNLSYQEIWNRNQRTIRILYVLNLVFIGVLIVRLLLVFR